MSKPEVIKIDARFDRFVEMVPLAGCWLWVGASSKNGGYGKFWNGEKYESAHRYSFRKKYGAIEKGMHVLHRCDVPSCVNPDHLFLGTQQDNINDAIQKGRHNRTTRAVGSNHGRAVLTEKQVIEMRGSVKSTTHFSRKFGINFMTLSCARRGKSWKHLPEKTK